MILLLRETTLLGDSYGRSVGRRGVTNKATRSFIVQVSPDSRSAEEIYSALPKLDDPHPDIVNCFVSDIDVKQATDDPHIYNATIEYKTIDSEDPSTHPREIVDYPWGVPPKVTFRSDTSQMQAMEFAYANWPFTAIEVTGGEIVTGSPSETYDTPSIPILNLPFNEKFKTVPEEPTACLAMDISFAVKGYTNNPKVHDRGIVYSLKAEYFTVNSAPVTILGYSFSPYCGYASAINMEAKYFKTKKGRVYAYYDVTISLLDNPSTWVRRILNMSFNKYVLDDNGEICKTHITLTNPITGLAEKVTEPMRVHPSSGEVLGVTEDGKIDDMEKRVYVLPFLTKKSSNWAGIKSVTDSAGM